MSKPDDKGQPPVTFKIDGVDYTVDSRRQTAADLLSLAELDPSDHDLALVKGQGEVEKRFSDEAEIQVTPGAKFISIFNGPTPVV